MILQIVFFLILTAVISALAIMVAPSQENKKSEFFALFRMMSFFIALFTVIIMVISIIFQ